MFKRNSVIALVFSAFALATLCLLAAVSTAQKGSFSTSAAKGAQRSRTNTTVLRPPFRFRPSQSGVSTSSWGKTRAGIPWRREPPALMAESAWTIWPLGVEVVPMTAAQKAANADGDSHDYVAVTITGNTLVGKTKARSLKVDKWQFVNPRANTARTATPDTYTNRIEFEIGRPTGGLPPSTDTTIIKSKSNICSN